MSSQADEQAIEQIVQRYGRALDAQDRAGILRCFSPDVHLDYLGGSMLVDGIDEVARRMFHFDRLRSVEGMERIESTTHIMNVVSLEIDAWTASCDTRCVAYLVGSHEGHDVVLVRGLRYSDELVRLQDGWRIQRRCHTPEWEIRSSDVTVFRGGDA